MYLRTNKSIWKTIKETRKKCTGRVTGNNVRIAKTIIGGKVRLGKLKEIGQERCL